MFGAKINIPILETHSIYIYIYIISWDIMSGAVLRYWACWQVKVNKGASLLCKQLHSFLLVGWRPAKLEEDVFIRLTLTLQRFYFHPVTDAIPALNTRIRRPGSASQVVEDASLLRRLIGRCPDVLALYVTTDDEVTRAWRCMQSGSMVAIRWSAKGSSGGLAVDVWCSLLLGRWYSLTSGSCSCSSNCVESAH